MSQCKIIMLACTIIGVKMQYNYVYAGIIHLMLHVNIIMLHVDICVTCEYDYVAY